MLIKKNLSLIASILTGPKAQRGIGAKHGLTAAQIRALLAVAALAGEYSSSVTVRDLYATKLAARTRLRDQVRVLVLNGCLTRKVERYRVHTLTLTTKGKQAVEACVLAIQRGANGFLYA